MKPVVLILTGLCAALTMTAVSEELSPEYQEGPHPVQGLYAFMERHGEKPCDLFLRNEDSLATHRLIFQDKQFGTEVWMIDDSPTVDHAGTASVWSAWNADGSTLYVGGARPAVWAPEDPDIYYAPINPEGHAWNDYGLPWFAEAVHLPTGLDMDELYDLWRNIPHVTHGHESPSPDWQYIATDGGETRPCARRGDRCVAPVFRRNELSSALADTPPLFRGLGARLAVRALHASRERQYPVPGVCRSHGATRIRHQPPIQRLLRLRRGYSNNATDVLAGSQITAPSWFPNCIWEREALGERR